MLKLRIGLKTFVLSAFIGLTCAAAAEIPVIGNGTFVVTESMSNLTPDEPQTRWFHENTITIRGKEVTLNKAPVFTKPLLMEINQMKDGSLPIDKIIYRRVHAKSSEKHPATREQPGF